MNLVLGINPRMDALLSELQTLVAWCHASLFLIGLGGSSIERTRAVGSAVLESQGHSQWGRPDPLLEPRRGFPFNV